MKKTNKEKFKKEFKELVELQEDINKRKEGIIKIRKEINYLDNLMTWNDNLFYLFIGMLIVYQFIVVIWFPSVITGFVLVVQIALLYSSWVQNMIRRRVR